MKSFVISGKIELPIKLKPQYFIPVNCKTKITLCKQSVQWNEDEKVIWYWSKLPKQNNDVVYTWKKP